MRGFFLVHRNILSNTVGIRTPQNTRRMDIFRHHLLLLTDTLFAALCVCLLIHALTPATHRQIRRTEITEALMLLQELRLQAHIQFAETGQWPDEKQLRLSAPTRHVAQLDVAPYQLTATLNSRSPALHGRTLSIQALRAGPATAPRLLWLCGYARIPDGWRTCEPTPAAPSTRTTVAASDLPASCR